MVDAVGIGPLPSSPNWRGVLAGHEYRTGTRRKGEFCFFFSFLFFSFFLSFPLHAASDCAKGKARDKLCEGVDLGR